MKARTSRKAKQPRKRKPEKNSKPITSNSEAESKKSEILNYDPRRCNRVEHLVELQEFIIIGDDNTKVSSIFIPVSKLIGKTKEEIELIVNHDLWAFNFDISHIDVSAGVIDGAAKELAHRYAR